MTADTRAPAAPTIATPAIATPAIPLDRIAAAVEPFPEGRDAAALANTLGHALGGDVLLVAIEPNLGLVVPAADLRGMRRATARMLAELRVEVAPGARTAVDTDLSAARGLVRQLTRNHRGLVVCGSSRRGRFGRVTLGGTPRQLLGRTEWALAVAPRGLAERGELRLGRIGVGFDGDEESRAALAAAERVAQGSGAELVVRSVIDDQFRALSWFGGSAASLQEAWKAVVVDEMEEAGRRLDAACAQLSVPVTPQLRRGSPPRSLAALSAEVDLLVVGSRRWGPAARLLLGGVGESLAHGARCSLLIVPRVAGSPSA